MKPLDYGSRKQKYETRQTPIATNTLDHPPTHPRRATAIRQSTTVVADALIQTELLCHWDFHALTIIRHPGERADPSPGGRLSTLPARRGEHGTRYAPGTGKGCCVGGDVAPQRDRGRPSGARDSQLFSRCFVTKMFSNIQMTTM